MIQSSRTFRVFVSSTFSDLKAERNALQQEVFPKLRKLCEEHGCRFQAIDLRWGVSEEAALDQQAMRICLEEVDRCQKLSPRPNFIVLLGDRYGWQPLPYEIPADEFGEIESVISPDEQELLAAWYQRDDNAVPPVYDLQPRTGQHEDFDIWNPVEKRLLTILRRAISSLNLSTDALVKYQASATEQEIVRGALDAEGSEEHVFCFFRNFETLPQGKEAADYIDLDENGEMDKEAHAKLQKLKEGLRKRLPGNVHEYEATWDKGTTITHLKQLCDDAYSELSGIILKEIEGLRKVDALDAEINEHKTFGQERARNFTGRKETLDAIAAYINSDSKQPLVIHGPSGSGKSALIAYAAENEAKARPDAALILRHIGATPSSSNIHSLLESLYKQIGLTYGQNETAIPTEFKELVAEFSKSLALATSEKPPIIFIDALDQLSDVNNAKSMTWLSVELPEHVKIIVSAITDDLSHKSLARRIDKDNLIQLPGMTDTEGEALLDLWMAEQGRTFQPQQKKEVLDKFHQNGLPLYLKLAFEMARGWKSYDEPKALNSDIHGIINEMFGRLSDDANHGQIMVSRSLAYLAASKNGLTEDELLDLLSSDKELMEDFKRRSPKSPKEVDRLPVVIWSRVYLDLKPYLTERSADNTSLLSFFHRQFGEVVAEKYLAGDEKTQRHTAIANYFAVQLYEIDETNRLPNYRKVSEIAYQMMQGKMWQELQDTLTDFEFAMTKCKAEMVDELVEDYQKANVLPVPDKQAMRIWAAFFRERAHILRRGNADWPAYKILLQLAVEHADDSPVTIGAEKYLEDGKVDWVWLRVRKDQRQKKSLITGCVMTIEHMGRSGKKIAITPDGKIMLCGIDKKVEVWDIDNCQLLREIRGTNGYVRTIEILPDGQVAMVSSGPEVVQMWDIETGQCCRDYGISWVDTISFCREGQLMITGGEGIAVCVIDVKSENRLHEFECHEDWVSTVRTMPGDQNVVSGGRECLFRLWNIETGELITTLGRSSDWIMSFVISADGRKLISGNNDGIIEIWGIESKQVELELRGHDGGVNSVVLIHEDTRVISGGADHTVRIWDIKEQRCLKIFYGHTDAVVDIVVTPNGKYAFSMGSNAITKMWDLQLLQEPDDMDHDSHIGPILSSVVNSDGTKLLSAGEDDTLRIWDIATGQCEKKFNNELGKAYAVALTLDSRIISNSPNGIQVWDVSSGECINNIGDDNVTCIAVTPDGRLIVSGRHNTVRIWDAEKGSCLIEYEGSHRWGLRNVAITSDGRRVISIGQEGLFHIYDRMKEDFACDNPAVPIERQPSNVTGLITSINGNLLAWVAPDIDKNNIIKLYDIVNNRSIHYASLNLLKHEWKEMNVIYFGPSADRISFNLGDNKCEWHANTIEHPFVARFVPGFFLPIDGQRYFSTVDIMSGNTIVTFREILNM